MIAFEDKIRLGGSFATDFAGHFFSGNDPVHKTLRSLAEQLSRLKIDYAVHDDLAMAVHGLEQTCDSVDVLVTPGGCQSAIQNLNGQGFIPVTARRRSLRDVTTGVRIDFLIAGEYPGDGKPKPIAFPTPVQVSVEVEGIHYINLPNFVELKLAVGINRPSRLRDLADIQEFIKHTRPPRSLADQLHEFVRPKFLELWDGLQNEPPEQ